MNTEQINVTDNVVRLAINKAKKAKKVIVRSMGSKYRMLDENVNPLINLNGTQFRFLTENGILRHIEGNEYRFNPTAKISA